MVFKKFLSVFTSAMFTILIAAGLVAVIFINVKQKKADAQVDPSHSDSTNVSPNDTPDFLDKYVETKQQPFNMLVFVSDIKGYDTDAIVLFNIDSENSKLSAMSIPRDTSVKNNQKAVSIYETSTNNILKDEKVIDIFEDFLNTEIKYTLRMNLRVVEKIVDELGGLYFNIPADMYYCDNGVDPVTGIYDPEAELLIDFKKGDKHLNGSEVVKLLRFRQSSPDVESTDLEQYYPNESDMDRIEMNKLILKAFSDQVFEMSRRNLLNKLGNLITAVYDDMDLYISLRDMQDILDLVMKSVPIDSNDNYLWQGIKWYTLPGEYINNSNGDYYQIDIPSTSAIINQSFKTSLD